MRIIKISFGTIAVAAFLLPGMVMAQSEKTKSGTDGVEQIVITRDNDEKNEKLVIEINGDKITINGKPADEYKNGAVTVSRNKYKELSALAYGRPAPQTRVRTLRNNGNLFLSSDENRAMLGVITENGDNGALIKEVTKESGAEKAGLKEGDIIKKIDDAKVENADDVTKIIRNHKPGDKVIITVLRDKKEQKITAELTKWKGIDLQIFNSPNGYNFNIPEIEVEGFPRSNFNWRTITDRPKLGISIQDTEDGKGVKIIDVDSDSNSEKAGIKEEDIITAINDKEVNSADEAARIIRENIRNNNATIKVKLIRKGKSQTIDVKIPRKLKTVDL